MKIEDLRAAFSSGVPIEYKLHCQKRMLERNITRKDIANAITYGEIIEDYPLDAGNISEASFPSYLILWIGFAKNEAIHVVVGFNGKKIIIISAYIPDSELWLPDLKTRKEI